MKKHLDKLGGFNLLSADLIYLFYDEEEELHDDDMAARIDMHE